MNDERPETEHELPVACECAICGYRADPAQPADLGRAHGNTERYLEQSFRLWKCPQCLSIHNLEPVEYADIYSEYPLNERKLDIFARGTLGNLLRRLVDVGVRKDQAILDYGSGNGVLVEFLQERGYTDTHGFDPYIPRYAEHPATERFDVVIANDVIEHVQNPKAMVRDCIDLLKPGGILYLGTADSEPVDMQDLEPHITRLHPPHHRVIITRASLLKLGEDNGLELLASFRRSYMDTRRPFSNYRFLDELLKAHGHNMDKALGPDAGEVFVSHPSLFFYAFFGYFLPSADEPAAIWRKPV